MAAWYQNKVEMGCLRWMILLFLVFVGTFILAAVVLGDQPDAVEEVQLLGARHSV